ncbi:hypothetical protein ABH995_000750 [Bradyrhizobium yuanmingense]
MLYTKQPDAASFKSAQSHVNGSVFGLFCYCRGSGQPISSGLDDVLQRKRLKPDSWAGKRIRRAYAVSLNSARCGLGASSLHASLVAPDTIRLSSDLVLLNTLLNETAEDADIIFILSSNRPEAIEAAPASRPYRSGNRGAAA